MDIFARLVEASKADWQSYTGHEFVKQMAAGTLSQAAFRTYLVQDYLFLIQFARANALAVYKSRTLSDMQQARGALSAILDVELNLHVELCGRWGLSRDDLAATPEHAATVAYTRFVLDCGQSGDLLDLNVALAPCVIGYAEIGRTIASQDAAIAAAHPYREWIGEYSGAAYQEVAAAARAWLDDLAARYMGENRFAELAGIFAKASRLEADFWQMGLDAG